MVPTCKLCAKCLKSDEGLEKFHMPECNNFIHLSCSKNLLKTFGEEEWEGLLLCVKRCFKHHKKSLTSVKSRIPKWVLWSSDGLVDEVNSMTVLIYWLTTADNYNRWCWGDKHNGSKKSVLGNKLLQLMTEIPKVQGRTFTTKSTIWSSSLELPGFVKSNRTGVTCEDSIKAAVV